MGEDENRKLYDERYFGLKDEIKETKDEIKEVKDSIKDINDLFRNILMWVIGGLVTGLGSIIYMILDKFVFNK